MQSKPVRRPHLLAGPQSVKNAVFAALTVALASCASGPREVAVEPRGEFATIDTSRAVAAIQSIQANDPTAIETALSSPGECAPPVLYAVSGALFDSGRRREAMFWFYAGQLRGRSDANKALDPSAKQAMSVLNDRYGPQINRLAFQDLESLRKTIQAVIEWDEKTERAYDPRWIALHGLDALTQSKVRFAPRSEWKEIDARTRDDYLEGFLQVLEMMRKRDMA